MEKTLTVGEVKTLISCALKKEFGRDIDPAAITFLVDARIVMTDLYENTAPQGEFRGVKIKI